MPRKKTNYERAAAQNPKISFRGAKGFDRKARRENIDYDRLTGGRREITLPRAGEVDLSGMDSEATTG